MPDPSPVVLITGASSGIGEATARLLGQAGYRLVLAARRMDRLERLADEIQQDGGEVYACQADLSHREDIQHLARVALEQYSQVDVLLNNAGLGRLDWLENLDADKDIEAQLQVNLHGMIYLTQALLPHMIARGSGHIINMSSIAGLIGTPTYSIYAASKYGERGFSEALRREVGVWGIRVSVIYPGAVRTEFSQQAGINRKTGMTTPAFLMLEPQEVAQVVLKVVRHPRRMVILPPVMRVAVWLNAAFPGCVDRVIAQRFVKPERL